MRRNVDCSVVAKSIARWFAHRKGVPHADRPVQGAMALECEAKRERREEHAPLRGRMAEIAVARDWELLREVTGLAQ